MGEGPTVGLPGTAGSGDRQCWCCCCFLSYRLTLNPTDNKQNSIGTYASKHIFITNALCLRAGGHSTPSPPKLPPQDQPQTPNPAPPAPCQCMGHSGAQEGNHSTAEGLPAPIASEEGQWGRVHVGHPSSPRSGLELLEFGRRERSQPFVLAGQPRWLPAQALPYAPPHQHPQLTLGPPSSLYFFGGGSVEAWEGSRFVCGVGQGLWAPSFQMQEVCS